MFLDVPTAKNLLLELLVAAGDAPLPARTAIRAAALFDISENSVRVALARLSSEGLVAQRGRGKYVLAPRARGLAREVAGWRDAEARVCRWNGTYVAVVTAALGRVDRAALRLRTRALSLLGFSELDRGLFIRPNNLREGVAGVATRLYALGLEAEAAVFGADDFSEDVEARIRGLWDGDALTESYTCARHELEAWLDRAPRLAIGVAARESFLLGSAAIRRIVFDPFLPPPFVDVAERRAFIDAMKVMDHEGRRIWKQWFERTEQTETTAAQ